MKGRSVPVWWRGGLSPFDVKNSANHRIPSRLSQLAIRLGPSDSGVPPACSSLGTPHRTNPAQSHTHLATKHGPNRDRPQFYKQADLHVTIFACFVLVSSFRTLGTNKSICQFFSLWTTVHCPSPSSNILWATVTSSAWHNLCHTHHTVAPLVNHTSIENSPAGCVMCRG